MTYALDEQLFLPEPEPREVRYTVISVDDHLCEPPGLFDGRLPAHLQDRAPRVIEMDGGQVWSFDDELFTEVGMAAFAGRRKETVSVEPSRFEHMRPGCYDIDARVSDMDINGVWAALNFPSMITGFCGRVYSQCSDPELGLATTKAWNDWMFEEWYSPYPERIIPMGITFLTDPEEGAREIYRNAERGVRSVTLPERPHRIGLPSLYLDDWEPIIRACAETDTVISLHVGSSGVNDQPEGSPVHLSATLFGQLSLTACADWLWSGWPVRFPNLKIAMSEGGIGWVAMLIDRLDNIVDRAGWETINSGAYQVNWDLRPSEVLRRNFWFCTIDDPSTIDTRHTIGVENVMFECDYPHSDGTWPDTQAVIEKLWGHIPAHELRMMCCENAASLYRHPLPEVVLPR